MSEACAACTASFLTKRIVLSEPAPNGMSTVSLIRGRGYTAREVPLHLGIGVASAARHEILNYDMTIALGNVGIGTTSYKVNLRGPFP